MKQILIDVRGPEEFAENHVIGAINIPVDELSSSSSQLQSLPIDTPIITYCRTGNRSELAKSILQSFGFNNVINGINQKSIESYYNL